MGFATFQTPPPTLRPAGPEGPRRRPRWRRPFEASSSLAAGPPVTASPCGCAFTEWRALSPLDLQRRVHVATVARRCPRPQGLVPPGSSLSIRRVAATHRSMLPWALDRSRSDVCRAHCTLDGRCRPFHLAVPPAAGAPPPESERKARYSVLSGSREGRCLLPAAVRKLRSAARQGRPAGSPKTATLPVPPDRNPEGIRPGSVAWTRQTRRPPRPRSITTPKGRTKCR